MILRFFISILVILLIEYYFFQAVTTVVRDASDNKKQIVKYIYLGVTGFLWLVGIAMIIYPLHKWNIYLRNYLAGFAVLLFLLKIIPAVLLFIGDIFRGLIFLFSKIGQSKSELDASMISRSKFLSWCSIFIAAVPGIGLIYGMVKGGYNYRIHRVKIASNKIPKSFNGFKMAQISDMHVGSFASSEHLVKAFDMLLNEKPDTIFFTGDMVNNVCDETEGFLPVFQKLKAEYGVYSIFGNHDYGDYVRDWASDAAKKENLERLKKVHADAGWKLMMNEHLHLEKGEDKIAVLGIENWGAHMNFPKYGKMKEAYEGLEKDIYKILLSHDPSHWEAEVLKQYQDIDLMLSGHTHGMQFGIEIPALKIQWSPVKYFYKQWAGLYAKGEQKLYVNRGLGFLGYPGRLGIWPEITIIELEST
jgi:uncharacterized protein